ncbi:MAG: selenocysteine-specific translation elongation factor [Actinobacteria bacterium]|nr:MAG: selenocysteine-specific translation elongation factor [Actinomycetota bacterium]
MEVGMRNVVVGTAGHVDHGKTALVERLTGVSTDRLPEERARGMSIELGVATHVLPSGRAIDLVDVPGHQRLVHTMLCGAAGIDAVAVVVAADDGPMPQTEEHLDILALLGIDNGFVVLNKCDAVDEELLALALRETRDMIAATALSGCSIVPASALTGEGIDEIERELERACRQVGERDELAAFRLPVDRVLRVPGAGTVVTGTVAAGQISRGQEVELFPCGRRVKVRTVQCRGQGVESAAAGDRVGLNLHGVEAASLSRGVVVADVDSLVPSHLLNVQLTYLSRPPLPLPSGVRVKLHTGTSEALGRVILMERECLLPGESGLAQLRLETPLTPAPGQRFIIRSLSPTATIGGGTILEVASRKYRPRHAASADTPELLTLMCEGGRVEAAEAFSRKAGWPGCRPRELATRLGVTEDAATGLLEALLRRGSVLSPAPRLYVNRKAFEDLKERTLSTIKRRYDDRPLERSMPSEEIRTRLSPAPRRETWQRAMAELADAGLLTMQGSCVAVPGYLPAPTSRQKARISGILQVCADSGVRPMKPDEIERHVGPLPRSELTALISFLVATGRLVRLDDRRLLTSEGLSTAREMILGRIREKGYVTLPEARDLLGIGRHPTQAILEYLDEHGATTRRGDDRFAGRAARRRTKWPTLAQ